MRGFLFNLASQWKWILRRVFLLFSYLVLCVGILTVAVSPSEAGEAILFGEINESDCDEEGVDTITCLVTFYKGDTVDDFLKRRIAPRLSLPLIFPRNLRIKDSLFPEPPKIPEPQPFSVFDPDIGETLTFVVMQDPREIVGYTLAFYRSTPIQALQAIASATGTRIKKTDSAIKLVYPSSGPNESKEK